MDPSVYHVSVYYFSSSLPYPRSSVCHPSPLSVIPPPPPIRLYFSTHPNGYCYSPPPASFVHSPRNGVLSNRYSSHNSSELWTHSMCLGPLPQTYLHLLTFSNHILLLLPQPSMYHVPSQCVWLRFDVCRAWWQPQWWRTKCTTLIFSTLDQESTTWSLSANNPSPHGGPSAVLDRWASSARRS